MGDRIDPEGLEKTEWSEPRQPDRQLLVRQDEGEPGHDEDGRDRRGDEQDRQVLRQRLGEVGRDQDGEVLGDGDPRGDAGALELGHLVAQDGDEGREGGVGADLGDEPAGGDQRHGAQQPHHDKARRHGEDADDEPGPAAAPAPRGAVGDLAEDDVGDDGAQCAQAGDRRDRGGLGGVVAGEHVDRLDLDGEDRRTHEGEEEEELRRQVGDHEQRLDRFGRRREEGVDLLLGGATVGRC